MIKEYEKHIETHPEVCGGSPVIKGTRVRIKVILDSLAEGHTPQEIVKSYPSLSQEDVYAVIAYAAAATSDDYDRPVPTALTE